ncbi:MAG: hypothetical protein K2N38_05265 [Oscillospiraceae bacterium]|nr:hypothetical protein [Oscillospiraceae bacterium]
MKSKVNKGVIIAASCFAALLIAAGITLYINSIKSYELCSDAVMHGWENIVEYSMLSKELKSIISEEEFTNDTPEGRLEMYQKLNGLVLDERPTKKFHGSTHGFKSPCMDMIEVNGQTYSVDITIETMGRLTGIEILNFYCYLYECRG